MSIMRKRRRRDGERGVELIEFALAFPILLMVVLGIVDFALVYHHNEVLTNAAREGARLASLPGYATVDVQNRVTAFVQTGGLPATPTVTVTPATIPFGAGTWPASTVTVSYQHNYLFIDAVAGWFGGIGNPTLNAHATMRHEVQP